MTRFDKMKLSVLLLVMSISLSSCEAIAGIFKAGVWTGIILVAFVIGLIVYFISRGRK
ncbi:MAG TPA: phosphatidate cytidylyltransferase [Ferruginibacter sp.]|nr:phosphatidate cytidylyltransferase [Ferruginibacter sp.]